MRRRVQGLEPSESGARLLAEEMRLAALEFAAKDLGSAARRLRHLLDGPRLPEKRRAQLQHGFGVVLLEAGKLGQAEHELGCAVTQLRVAGSRIALAQALDDLGMAYVYEGKLNLAIRTHREALRIRLLARDRRGVAQSCDHLAIVALKQRRHVAALRRALVALVLHIFSDRARRADVFDTLGKACAGKRWLRCAMAAHRHALGLRAHVRDDIAVAKTLTNLGVVHRRTGDLRASLTCHQAAMQIRSRHDDIVGIANSHNNLGLVLTDLAEWARARHHLRKAFVIRTSLGDTVNSQRNAQNLRRLASLAPPSPATKKALRDV